MRIYNLIPPGENNFVHFFCAHKISFQWYGIGNILSIMS